MNIIINGQNFDWHSKTITYREVADLVKKPYHASCTYHVPPKGDVHRHGLMYDNSIKILVEDGMIFDIVVTGNA